MNSRRKEHRKEELGWAIKKMTNLEEKRLERQMGKRPTEIKVKGSERRPAKGLEEGKGSHPKAKGTGIAMNPVLSTCCTGTQA